MSTAHWGFPKIRGKLKRVYTSYRDYIGISKGFLGFPTIRVTSLGVRILRSIVYRGPYWGSPILGTQ